MDVTHAGSRHFRRSVSNPGLDQDIFSETADRTHKINSLQSGRPMRGGIRL